MTLSNQSDNLRQQREEFISEWQLTEKAAERIAGLLLIFSGALLIVFDKPGDQLTALAIAGFIAGGFTMIFRSRRPADARKPLAFIQTQALRRRALMAFIGAAFSIWQSAAQNRFLYLLIGGLLILLMLWYRWREQRVRHFDSLFPKSLPTIKESESDE